MGKIVASVARSSNHIFLYTRLLSEITDPSIAVTVSFTTVIPDLP